MTDKCAAEGCTTQAAIRVPVRLCRNHCMQVYTGLLEDLLGAARGKEPPPVRDSRERARKAFTTRMDELFAQGNRELFSRDFTDVARKAGRSRSWIYYCLDQLTESGVLERDGSTYRKKEER
jgi:hypothetical protein